MGNRKIILIINLGLFLFLLYITSLCTLRLKYMLDKVGNIHLCNRYKITFTKMINKIVKKKGEGMYSESAPGLLTKFQSSRHCSASLYPWELSLKKSTNYKTF